MDSRLPVPRPIEELLQEEEEEEKVEVEEVEKEEEEEKEVEEEEEEEVEKEEEEDQDQLPLEEVAEKPLSQDLMPMETQSFTRREEPENTEAETINMKVKIEKTVPVEPEEKERKVVKETTKRRVRKARTPKPPSRKLRSKKHQRLLFQKLSMKSSENHLMISSEEMLPTLREPKMPELLKVLKELKPLKVLL